MIERLVMATIIVAVCFGIGLLIFLPVRWLALRSNPEAKQQTVPIRTVALWIGVPVLCVYAFAIHPAFGAAVAVGALLFVAVGSVLEYTSMPQEKKQELAEALEIQSRKPSHRIIRYIAYGIMAVAVLSLLKDYVT